MRLPEDQLRQIVGGGEDPVSIKGGTIQNTDQGVVWMGDDGRSCTFYGVSFSVGGLCLDDSAYQLSGTIRIGREWLEDGFSVYDFAHEFGRYLQQCEYGTLNYITDVAIPSAWDSATNRSQHSSQPYEKDATKRGDEYLKKNLK